jgi:CheY-like chemotaxis protein
MKVLIVDDEPLVRRSLQKAFERLGHQVQVAEDGVTGLQKWQQFLPDVVFLDVLMPQMTGPQLLEKIDAESRNRTKVVMMSAYSGHQEPGLADRFVAKPFEDVFDLVKLGERLIIDG